MPRSRPPRPSSPRCSTTCPRRIRRCRAYPAMPALAPPPAPARAHRTVGPGGLGSPARRAVAVHRGGAVPAHPPMDLLPADPRSGRAVRVAAPRRQRSAPPGLSARSRRRPRARTGVAGRIGGVARGPGTADSAGMETWITELTPLSFLERSADVHPDKVAVVYGPDRWTYGELAQRVQELAAALRAAGVGPGDRVAYLLPNVPEMLVAHFAVPLAGAVLVAINTRLSAEEVRYICDHSGSLILVVDAAFAPSVAPVAGALETVRTIVTLVDPHGPPAGEPIPGSIAYADLAGAGDGGDAALDRRRRARHDLDQLHLGHHRAAQGRHVQPPRRLPQRARRGAALVVHARQRLPLDAADVPLQRLVHDLGARRGRRHPGLPARGPGRRDLAADRHRGRHPPQRRAHRRRHRPRLPAGARRSTSRWSSPPPRRRPARRRWRGPSGWASRSCTSTASPRPTARTRCASGSTSGTGSTRSSGPGCGPGRASG